MSDARNTNTFEPHRPNTPDPESSAGSAEASPGSDQTGGGTGPENPRQLAHELNNLLDGSLRNLSLALAELRSPDSTEAAEEPVPEETARKLRTANDSMQQMAELLRRWMAGTDEPGEKTGETSLGEAIENVQRQIEPLLTARRIALNVNLPPELTDEPAGALQQVLSNAVRNAVEAVDQDGRIELSCERTGDRLVLRVRDDGPGPPPALSWGTDGLPEPGVSTKPGGHGMGLTISRRIAEAMGGSLQLEPAPGGGAVLTLRWPATRSRKPTSGTGPRKR